MGSPSNCNARDGPPMVQVFLRGAPSPDSLENKDSVGPDGTGVGLCSWGTRALQLQGAARRPLTVGDLKRAVRAQVVPLGSTVDANEPQVFQDIRLSYRGRSLLNDEAYLEDEDIGDGVTLELDGRLRGGSLIKLRVQTMFGCSCCNQKCFCLACRGGRLYRIEVNNIANVDSIFEQIGEQNPAFSKASKLGTLTTNQGIVLERGRKIIIYDLEDNNEIKLQVPPHYWFKRDFRKGPKMSVPPEEEEEDEEYRAAVAKLREHKMGAHKKEEAGAEEEKKTEKEHMEADAAADNAQGQV